MSADPRVSFYPETEAVCCYLEGDTGRARAILAKMSVGERARFKDLMRACIRLAEEVRG